MQPSDGYKCCAIALMACSLLATVCVSKKKDASLDSVSEFLDKQRQKLADSGVSCPLKKLTVKAVHNHRLTHQNDAAILCILEALRDPDIQTDGLLWSTLGSLFVARGNSKGQATTCFKLATKLTGKISLHVKEWSFIGPFVVGKMELDGDPLEAFGGIRNVSKYRYRKASHVYSELLPGGEIKWSFYKQATATAMVKISPTVNWNDLVNSLGSLGITEWQGWAVGEIAVNENNLNILIQCLGFHTVYVDDTPVTGDVYHRDQYWYGVRLQQGIHTIYIKLRTKGIANFKCSLKLIDKEFEVLKPSFLPDLYNGYLFGDYITVHVANYHRTDFLKVTKVAFSDQSGDSKLTAELVMKRLSIVPGQIYPVVIKLSSKSREISTDCSDVDLRLKLTTSSGVEILPITLRCRKIKESVLFTFLDHDGSVQHAATVHPIKHCPQGVCPTLLTLHGTTVPPQNQADSYKMMVDGEFVFGAEYCWLLAPTRHGAHNWEGPGILTALTALQSLAKLTAEGKWLNNKADAHHVIYAGHSMGGHGAWHLATHYPDRAVAMVTLAGWIKKEEYGDSNLFFKHDTATSHVDPAIKMVMEACIVENDADKHISNLQGIPVLARIGAQDRTVHPFFVRRMYRLLREIRVDVNYTELAGKEHWWWDTWDTNDGGVVNDQQLRDFTNRHSEDFVMAQGECQGEACSGEEPKVNRYTRGQTPGTFLLTCYNPALGEGLHGIRILQQITPYRLSQIQGEVKDNQVILTTTNVRRLSISVPPNRQIFHQGLGLQVDGGFQLQPSDVILLKEESQNLCRDKGGWSICQDDTESGSVRGPSTLGPARRIAEQAFLIIIGTGGSYSAYIQQAAVYISNLFLLTSDARAPIVRDTDIEQSALDDKNVILIGDPKVNRHTGSYLEAVPFDIVGDTVVLRDCTFSHPRTGVLSLAPNGAHNLALILMGLTEEGLQDVVSLATPTIPPMTRSPFSNLVPDFVVTGPEFGWKGPGGYLCAGFWGNSWEYRSDLTSCACQL